MVQTLESIRGGGGSVKVGTTGKISALMSREIESTKPASTVPSVSTSVPSSAGEITPRKLKSRKSLDEASISDTIDAKNDKCPETVKKTKHQTGKTHQIPMLTADNISLEGTPIRTKPVRKGPGIVEIVDIKCGNPDKTWTHRLKKLGFSKLSDSIGFVTVDSRLDLENSLVVAKLCRPKSIRLKYSISCMTREPTVPRVPIATGFD